MSDYISREEVIELLYKTFDEYSMGTDKQDSLGGFGAEVFKRVKAMQTVDEKEIIRKAFERVVERLEEMEKKALRVQNYDVSFYATGQMHKAIEIVKEECGISE